jgi:methylmalonyl-CoA mutase N-terminal domain/subunit
MSKLFESFIPTDDAVWKKLTEEELKGADINALPLWKESDGFSAHPAYFRSETEKLPMFGQTIRPLRFNQENNDWLTCCDVLVKDAAQANEEILHKLDLGASALTIDLNGKDFARDEIDILFQGVVVSAISISFYHAFNALRFQADYFDWAQKQGMSPASLKGGLWFDDLNGDLALALVRDKRYHSFGAIGLDGGQFYAKGANIPQQLGATLAWGNEILNGLRLQGLSFEEASNNIGFSLAVRLILFARNSQISINAVFVGSGNATAWRIR